jgi:heme O synthase-like polyprenyltransferase
MKTRPFMIYFFWLFYHSYIILFINFNKEYKNYELVKINIIENKRERKKVNIGVRVWRFNINLLGSININLNRYLPMKYNHIVYCIKMDRSNHSRDHEDSRNDEKGKKGK